MVWLSKKCYGYAFSNTKECYGGSKIIKKCATDNISDGMCIPIFILQGILGDIYMAAIRNALFPKPITFSLSVNFLMEENYELLILWMRCCCNFPHKIIIRKKWFWHVNCIGLTSLVFWNCLQFDLNIFSPSYIDQWQPHL